MLMKKISLLLLLMMAFTVSAVGQALPIPATPGISEFIDYGADAMQMNLGYDIPQTLMTNEPVDNNYTLDKEFGFEEGEFTILDKDKVSFSIFFDNDQVYTFTPEMFPQIGNEPLTRIPFNTRMPNGNIGYSDIHFIGVSNEAEVPMFTWRIGIQTYYTDNGQTSASEMYYMEVYPQLKEAANVTPTSFFVDWSCDAENTYLLSGFRCYELFVVDKATQEIVLQTEVAPTNPISEGGISLDYVVPGATYTVEGLTPGRTYQYYVVCSDSNHSFTSAVHEVTLPMSLQMLPADENYVNKTSFRAEWTNAADPSTVLDYTLYVTPQGSQSILTETFSGVTVENDANENIANYLNQYCDNQGWDGSYLYQAAGGGLKAGNSSNGGVLISPALDLSNSGGVITVKFNGKYYNTDKTTVTVSCGDASQTVELTADPTDYTVVLSGVPAAAGQKVTISSSGSRKRWYIYNVEVLTGNADAVAEPMVFTGITDTNYTVQNLTPGTTYDYYVVANYVDGTTETSNTESVTLPMPSAPALIVDPETLSISASYGETVTATFQVLGSDLTGNVTIALDDETGMFSVTPATISIADAEAGATVTVTYSPTETGTHTAYIAVRSEDVEEVEVTVNGTATIETTAPVMLPDNEEYVTSTSFRADWTDETNPAFVQDYTLYVNIKPDAPENGAQLLNETFFTEDAPTSDGTQDIGESLDDYCDNDGWTGYAVYRGGGGGMKLSSGTKTGYITSPALNMINCGGQVTVNFNAKSYGNDNSSIIVKCGEVADTIQLTSEAADYTVVLDGVAAADGQHVTLSCVKNGKRLYIYGVNIINGVQFREVVETGDENTRVITGITDKYYVVENLTPGATYQYYVKANYVNNTSALSNVEEVTLPLGGHGFDLGDVNHDHNVNITDVTLLIAYVLAPETSYAVCPICADVNGDTNINITDVTLLISIVLNAE